MLIAIYMFTYMETPSPRNWEHATFPHSLNISKTNNESYTPPT